MTPPQPISGQQSALSSPKKLLTPIKKMFGHGNPKSVLSITASGDSLNSALYSDLAPPHARFTQNYSSPSIPTQGNLSKAASPRRASNSRRQSASSLDKKTISWSTPTVPPAHKFAVAGANAALQGSPMMSSKKQQRNVPPPQKPQKEQTKKAQKLLVPSTESLRPLQTNTLNASIAKSVEIQPPQSESPPTSKAESSKKESDGETEDEDDDSDASSQFSFVRDIRGGRNTSVKYYKTRVPNAKKPLDPNLQLNTFDVNDLGYEDDMSDYDYENNGLDDDVDDDEIDDEEIDNDFQVNMKYDDMLDENDLRGLSVPGLDDLQPPPLHTPSPRHSPVFNSPSTFPSENTRGRDILGALSISSETPTSSNEQASEDDLLESYLDNAKLRSSDALATPKQLSFPFHNPENVPDGTSSPLINGVTFGSADRFYSRRSGGSRNSGSVENVSSRGTPLLNLGTPKHELGLAISTDPEVRALSPLAKQTPDESEDNTATSIMGLLGKLEQNSENLSSNEKIEARKSIHDIEQLLLNIQGSSDQEVKASNKRELIANMMDTLAKLDEALGGANQKSTKGNPRESVVDMMNTLALLDSQNESQATEKPETVTEASEEPPLVIPQGPKMTPPSVYRHYRSESEDTPSEKVYHLDEDMLDECNQLPEDYDFEANAKNTQTQGLSDFYRSNSYNKKPKKVLPSNTYQTNKIDTPQRTVTFYRSNSKGNSSFSNSGNLSRAGSLYSATSITSEEDSLAETDRFTKKPYTNINIQLDPADISPDSVSRKSFNLEPITES